MFKKYSSYFSKLHSSQAEILIKTDYNDYENTFTFESLGDVTGDLQPYSGEMAQKEYGLDIKCRCIFYCDTDNRIKEGVYMRIDNEIYSVVSAPVWDMGTAAMLKKEAV